MLFSSYDFLFLFLPVTLLGYVLVARYKRTSVVAWLLIMSLVFYGWWNPAYLALIGVSIIFNHFVGLYLSRWPSRALLAFGVVFNLAVIAYFKYAGFFQDIVNELSGTQFTVFSGIILPIAISFFTFQQIAYLVDSHKGLVKKHSFVEYALFVTFFPQLLAGPIVHHQEMLSQFRARFKLGLRANDVACGLTIFAIGLFKKVVIADFMAPYADPVFAAAAKGLPVYTLEAWGAALAFTFQIYYDFSGYSDMAIGLGLMFSIHLPINFASPYKARSIIDFWRRWHITLSRFLRDYLYFPLGGKRGGEARRYTNIMIVMCIGGLWHGAAWNFMVWGGLHGFYLLINHAWRFSAPAIWREYLDYSSTGKTLSWFVTILAVVIAWVIFRADNLPAAVTMLRAMIGLDGALALSEVHLIRLEQFVPSVATALSAIGIDLYPRPSLFEGSILYLALMIPALFIAVGFFPNTQDFFLPWHKGDNIRARIDILQWRFNLVWAIIAGLGLGYAIRSIHGVNEFIYFQF